MKKCTCSMERDHGKCVHKSCDMVHVAWSETMEKVYINHVTWYMLQDQRTSCEYLTKTNVIIFAPPQIYLAIHSSAAA